MGRLLLLSAVQAPPGRPMERSSLEHMRRLSRPCSPLQAGCAPPSSWAVLPLPAGLCSPLQAGCAPSSSWAVLRLPAGLCSLFQEGCAPPSRRAVLPPPAGLCSPLQVGCAPSSRRAARASGGAWGGCCEEDQAQCLPFSKQHVPTSRSLCPLGGLGCPGAPTSPLWAVISLAVGSRTLM